MTGQLVSRHAEKAPLSSTGDTSQPYKSTLTKTTKRCSRATVGRESIDVDTRPKETSREANNAKGTNSREKVTWASRPTGRAQTRLSRDRRRDSL